MLMMHEKQIPTQLEKWLNGRKYIFIQTFVFFQVKIFSGSFGGSTLWENPKYVSPAKLRQAFSKKAGSKYENRIEQKAVYEATRPETGYPDMDGGEFFKGDPLDKAMDEVVKGKKYYHYCNPKKRKPELHLT